MATRRCEMDAEVQIGSEKEGRSERFSRNLKSEHRQRDNTISWFVSRRGWNDGWNNESETTQWRTRTRFSRNMDSENERRCCDSSRRWWDDSDYIPLRSRDGAKNRNCFRSSKQSRTTQRLGKNYLPGTSKSEHKNNDGLIPKNNLKEPKEKNSYTCDVFREECSILESVDPERDNKQSEIVSNTKMIQNKESTVLKSRESRSERCEQILDDSNTTSDDNSIEDRSQETQLKENKLERSKHALIDISSGSSDEEQNQKTQLEKNKLERSKHALSDGDSSDEDKNQKTHLEQNKLEQSTHSVIYISGGSSDEEQNQKSHLEKNKLERSKHALSDGDSSNEDKTQKTHLEKNKRKQSKDSLIYISGDSSDGGTCKNQNQISPKRNSKLECSKQILIYTSNSSLEQAESTSSIQKDNPVYQVDIDLEDGERSETVTLVELYNNLEKYTNEILKYVKRERDLHGNESDAENSVNNLSRAIEIFKKVFQMETHKNVKLNKINKEHHLQIKNLLATSQDFNAQIQTLEQGIGKFKQLEENLQNRIKNLEHEKTRVEESYKIKLAQQLSELERQNVEHWKVVYDIALEREELKKENTILKLKEKVKNQKLELSRMNKMGKNKNPRSQNQKLIEQDAVIQTLIKENEDFQKFNEENTQTVTTLPQVQEPDPPNVHSFQSYKEELYTLNSDLQKVIDNLHNEIRQINELYTDFGVPTQLNEENKPQQTQEQAPPINNIQSFQSLKDQLDTLNNDLQKKSLINYIMKFNK